MWIQSPSISDWVHVWRQGPYGGIKLGQSPYVGLCNNVIGTLMGKDRQTTLGERPREKAAPRAEEREPRMESPSGSGARSPDTLIQDFWPPKV